MTNLPPAEDERKVSARFLVSSPSVTECSSPRAFHTNKYDNVKHPFEYIVQDFAGEVESYRPQVSPAAELTIIVGDLVNKVAKTFTVRVKTRKEFYISESVITDQIPIVEPQKKKSPKFESTEDGLL